MKWGLCCVVVDKHFLRLDYDCWRLHYTRETTSQLAAATDTWGVSCLSEQVDELLKLQLVVHQKTKESFFIDIDDESVFGERWNCWLLFSTTLLKLNLMQGSRLRRVEFHMCANASLAIEGISAAASQSVEIDRVRFQSYRISFVASKCFSHFDIFVDFPFFIKSKKSDTKEQPEHSLTPNGPFVQVVCLVSMMICEKYVSCIKWLTASR